MLSFTSLSIIIMFIIQISEKKIVKSLETFFPYITVESIDNFLE